MSYGDKYNKFVDKVRGLVSQGDYIQAAIQLESWLSEKPYDRYFQKMLSSVLIKLGRLEEAKIWLSRVIEKYRKSSMVDAYYYEALYHYIDDNILMAIESLRNCFETEIHYLQKIYHDDDFSALLRTDEFQELITPTLEFTLNEYLTLKLLFSKTLIYLCGDLFLTCQKVALSLTPLDVNEYDGFDTIDEIIEAYQSRGGIMDSKTFITPEQEFWAHCSNMQAWVENHYDTRVLARDISFPILEELTRRGIPYFRQIFVEELIARIKLGGVKSLLYFIDREDNLLDYLTEDEVIDGFLPSKETNILRDITRFIAREYTLTSSLSGARRFHNLKNEKNMLFCVEDGHLTELEVLLPEVLRTQEYLKALREIKTLPSLTEIAVYFTHEIEDAQSPKGFEISFATYEEFEQFLENLYI